MGISTSEYKACLKGSAVKTDLSHGWVGELFESQDPEFPTMRRATRDNDVPVELELCDGELEITSDSSYVVVPPDVVRWLFQTPT